MSEAMKVFGFVLDNSQEVLKQINQNVYNILGVNTQDEKISEFIMSELNNFDFNRVERELISNIRKIMDETLKPLENPNENNYEAIITNLINNLKSLKFQEFLLDNNFKDLSAKIVTKFPLTGITQEQFYLHFISKTEKVNEVINKYNNEVIDTLIKFSPQLVSEIQQSRSKQTSNEPEPKFANPSNPEPINPTNNGNSNFVPSDYRREERQLNNPDTPPSVSTYIGATNEDVEKLIKANEYYSLLHGIERESFMKYNGFIQTGFNIIINDYYNRSSACNTLDERLQAFAELKQIYQNFDGYITMEQSNQLREQLENMSKFLKNQQSQQLVDDISIRYNTGTREDNKSSRRM